MFKFTVHGTVFSYFFSSLRAATHSDPWRWNLGRGLFLSGLARAAQGFSSMRIDAVMLYGWEKSKIKAPGTGFMRSIRIHYVPNPLLNAMCPLGVLNSLWPWELVSIWRTVIGCPRGWCNSSSCRATCGDWLSNVRQQVGVTGQLLHINAVLLSIGQTSPDKCLCFRCYYWLWRKLYFSSFKNSILL